MPSLYASVRCPPRPHAHPAPVVRMAGQSGVPPPNCARARARVASSTRRIERLQAALLAGGRNAMSRMHEVDYKIFGDDMQFVEIELDPQEAVVAEAGGMMYMDDGIGMETIFGDGSQQQRSGVLGALMGAGKRLLIGESLFMTVFQNQANDKRHVAFGAPIPGKIVAVNLGQMGGELICQKDAFLAAAKGVSIGIAFQRKLGVGLFG